MEEKLRKVLIECGHIGNEFRRARKNAGISLNDAAKMLGLTRRQLLGYEWGKDPFPDNIVHRLSCYGYILMRDKNITEVQKK